MSDGLICSHGSEHMGIMAETLAEQYDIAREEQDDFAYNSHVKAAKAIEADKFSEIEVKTRRGTETFKEQK